MLDGLWIQWNRSSPNGVGSKQKRSRTISDCVIVFLLTITMFSIRKHLRARRASDRFSNYQLAVNETLATLAALEMGIAFNQHFAFQNV